MKILLNILYFQNLIPIKCSVSSSALVQMDLEAVDLEVTRAMAETRSASTSVKKHFKLT